MVNLVYSVCLAWAFVSFKCTSFPFGFEGGMLDLIVLFPDQCFLH